MERDYEEPIVIPEDNPIEPAAAACVPGVAGVVACAGLAFVYGAAVYEVVVAVNYGAAAVAAAAGAAWVVGVGVDC